LEKNHGTNNHSVPLMGDLNIPNFDLERGLPLLNSHSYSKLKGDAVDTSACLLGLTQFLVTDNSLDPVFTNFSLINTFFGEVGFVKSDPYHPPIVTEIPLVLHNYAISRAFLP
jgi:hypothetical protein